MFPLPVIRPTILAAEERFAADALGAFGGFPTELHPALLANSNPRRDAFARIEIVLADHQAASVRVVAASIFTGFFRRSATVVSLATHIPQAQ